MNSRKNIKLNVKKVQSRMTNKNQIVNSLEGFTGGSVSSNFPSNDITRIGLVRTHSIHKNAKVIGIRGRL
ncbi:MAG: hypothetical protein KJ799_01100 [Bacteroidetes bacterium]|nr:hypothetical protein [Bacteroidota bacterium]MBU1679337.1 hypothetical protein [Bacteroidota bacterium]MBU2505314.1 hypothetical protein [Bacteroidota bacterium]